MPYAILFAAARALFFSLIVLIVLIVLKGPDALEHGVFGADEPSVHTMPAARLTREASNRLGESERGSSFVINKGDGREVGGEPPGGVVPKSQGDPGSIDSDGGPVAMRHRPTKRESDKRPCPSEAERTLCQGGCDPDRRSRGDSPIAFEGTFRAGRPEVVGDLDSVIIRRVVHQHRRELRHCYELQLQEDHALAGIVKTNFVISPAGSIVSARISSTTLGNVQVEDCIVKRVRRWVFPEPRAGDTVKVTFPFRFYPSP